MKKMKYILLFVLGIVFFPSIVFADECDNEKFKCLVCEYEYDGYFSYTYTYKIKADGLGTASIEIIDEWGQKYSNNIKSDLKVGDFYTVEKDDLVCPTIKANTEINENNDKIDVTLLKDSNLTEDTVFPNILEDNDKDFIDPNRETTNFMCDIYSKSNRFPMIHANYIDGVVSYSIESNRYRVDNSFIEDKEVEIFSKGCNHTFYVNCDNDSDTCILSLSELPSFSIAVGMDSTSDEIERDERLEEAENNAGSGNGDYRPDPLCGENGENCDISLKGICEDPKVARTLQFLGFLLFLAKILVPAIIIIMGIVNLVKIITAGKTDDAPKYVKSIITRIIIGVSIFLLPGFINFIFDMASGVINDHTSNNDFDNCIHCIFDPNNKEQCKIDN